MSKFKHLVKTWKELEILGIQTPAGLLIPPNVCGLKATTVVTNDMEEYMMEQNAYKKFMREEKGRIISIGII